MVFTGLFSIIHILKTTLWRIIQQSFVCLYLIPLSIWQNYIFCFSYCCLSIFCYHFYCWSFEERLLCRISADVLHQTKKQAKETSILTYITIRQNKQVCFYIFIVGFPDFLCFQRQQHFDKSSRISFQRFTKNPH